MLVYQRVIGGLTDYPFISYFDVHPCTGGVSKPISEFKGPKLMGLAKAEVIYLMGQLGVPMLSRWFMFTYP